MFMKLCSPLLYIGHYVFTLDMSLSTEWKSLKVYIIHLNFGLLLSHHHATATQCLHWHFNKPKQLHTLTSRRSSLVKAEAKLFLGQLWPKSGVWKQQKKIQIQALPLSFDKKLKRQTSVSHKPFVVVHFTPFWFSQKKLSFHLPRILMTNCPLSDSC